MNKDSFVQFPLISNEELWRFINYKKIEEMINRQKWNWVDFKLDWSERLMLEFRRKRVEDFGKKQSQVIGEVILKEAGWKSCHSLVLSTNNHIKLSVRLVMRSHHLLIYSNIIIDLICEVIELRFDYKYWRKFSDKFKFCIHLLLIFLTK